MALIKPKSKKPVEEAEGKASAPETPAFCEDCQINTLAVSKFVSGKLYEGKRIISSVVRHKGGDTHFLCEGGCSYILPRAEYEAL